jgi:O-antigen ligase
MKKLFFIEDSTANKISYYHLLLLLFSLPFDFFYSHVILISFAVHTFLHVKKADFKPLFKTRTIILQSVFWVTLICIIYTTNKNEAYTELGRQAVILLMPILFCLTLLDLKKYREQLLMGFALCCTLTVAYLYFDAFRVIRFYHYPLNTFFTQAFTNHNFSAPISMHATFFSLQVALALVYMLSALLKRGSFNHKILYTVCCIILSAGLVQLCSKSVFVALLIAINLAVPIFILNGRSRVKFIICSMLITAAAVVVLSRSDTFKERYYTDLEKDMSQASTNETTDPRLARWGVAMELIGRSPVIGHGSGSEIALLKEAYFNKKLYSSYLNGLNAHNEYLSFLLKSGIVGLLVYLIALAYGFKNAIAIKDVLFFTFMLLVAIVSLSENLLDVDKGTMFYGLFFSFFVFSGSKKLPHKTQ